MAEITKTSVIVGRMINFKKQKKNKTKIKAKIIFFGSLTSLNSLSFSKEAMKAKDKKKIM